MPRQLRHLSKAWVFPDQNLILRVTVSAHLPKTNTNNELIHSIQYFNYDAYQFRRMFGPCQIAHLRSGINILHGLPGKRVPEADAPIGSASAAGQNSVVVRRPGDGFDGGQVLGERLHGRQRVESPHKEFVIVAAGGQQLIVGRPLQSAHFLPVP